VLLPHLNKVIISEKMEVIPHELIGDTHQFPKHTVGIFGNTNVISQRFGHLVYTVKANE